MKSDKKLQLLRQYMQKQGLAAYLQPVHDQYLSEYPPACNRRVEWFTGFTGSAGAVAVTLDKAALFIDGRYILQAANETDHALFARHNSGDLAPEAWLAAQLKPGERAGYDPRLTTRDMLRRLHTALDAKAIVPAAVDNAVDAIWDARPAAPATPLFVQPPAYAGETSHAKRGKIAERLATLGADCALITAPDAICWLFNIRANDVEHTPLALSVATVDAHGHAQLYIARARCSDEVMAHLGEEVTLREPDMLESDLTQLGAQGKRVLADPQSAPIWYSQFLSAAGADIVDAPEPSLLLKAVKNPIELQGIRDAHIRDGVAVCKLLCWLESEALARPVSEIEVADKLLAFRAQSPEFREPSFPTIAGSGPHGAIVHYRATPESNRTLREGELFLLDSGGQYPDGTTDITRTIAIGKPDSEQIDRFTRVLQGHIAIATACFPEGTSGSQLDALARRFLWQAGFDYDHGTGHGVGHYLGVHEGPQRISKRGGDAALKPGMVVSNEPGYYKTGEYGIRIENLVAVVEKETGSKTFLGFETLTCVPIDTRLVDAARLSEQEKAWLNDYHDWVLAMFNDAMTPQEATWLKARCMAL